MNVGIRKETGTAYRLSGALQVLLIAGACLSFYAPMFPALIREWYEHENFSYGFLIPLIFAYLIWQQRDGFGTASFAPSGWGAAFLCLSLVVGLTGKILGEPFVYRFSFVLATASLVHVFWGFSSLKRAAFPLAFLLLMVPPPYSIVKEVSYHLRMSDAWIAQNVAQALGVPVYRDGHLLHLPNITLEVADVCSGIASLFAMLALGTIYLYYLPVRWRLKVVVLFGIFVFPILANLLRIILVTVSVYYYGPIMLQAFFHRFTGTFTFMLSVMLLLWLGETLRRRYPLAATGVSGAAFVTRPESEISPKLRGRLATLLTSIAIAAAALIFARFQFTELAPPQESYRNLEEHFASIGNYRGTFDRTLVAYTDPRAEKSVAAVYNAPDHSRVELFLGYMSRQFDENRLQSPKLVFPKGSEYVSLENVRIPASENKMFDAAGIVTKSATQTTFVMFWYYVRGQSFASDLRNRLELIKGWLLYGRTDGVVVRLATPVSPLESASDAKRRLIRFSEALYPRLASAFPN